jgi:starch-binding outer membrane protein, SusD/RagB family
MLNTSLTNVARRCATRSSVIALALATVACSDFLDPDPKDVLAPENFYRTSSDALSAVNAVYEANRGIYFLSFWYLADIASDDIVPGPRFGSDGQRMSAYTFDASDDFPIGDQWRGNYRAINRANAVIERVPGITMDVALRDRLVAEARFNRAHAYFNLVRFYGDVPLIEHETKSLQGLDVARTPAADVYAFIVADLQAAAATLPVTYDASDVGRATKGAALALLAKVYLQQKDWANAAATAGQVISSGTYHLNEDWKDNFRIAVELVNPESIFEVNYDADLTEGGGSVQTLFSLPDGYPGGDAFGIMSLTPDIVAQYEPNDVRGLGGTFITSPYVNEAGQTITWAQPPGPAYIKYLDQSNTQNTTSRSWVAQPNNWIVLRYADVLLMYAEAVANGAPETAGSALDALNQVRTRAGLAPFGALTLDDVRAERRREFVFEGQRWFDLVRYGLLDQAITAKTGHPPKGDLFPIAQSERDLNPQLTQNPGY